MNGSESAFFFELQKQLPQEYYIFPKMRIIDFISPINREYGLRNRIWAKHIDFLICSKNFQPVVAIEVNGKSHLRQDRIERDDLVRQIFQDAKLPLEFVDVGTSFIDSVKQLQHHFS